MAKRCTVKSDKHPAELLNSRISAEQGQQLNTTAKQRKQFVNELVRQLISEQLLA